MRNDFLAITDDTPTKEELVVLVDLQGNPIGIKNKIEAHQNGDLHSAFSIFIFNDKAEILLQRREIGKYHSGGLWSNTCCSHPFHGESIVQAGQRRLQEEMGFSCELFEAFTTIYNVRCNNELVEHEYNTVLVGRYNRQPNINKAEVDEWKWVSTDDLYRDIKNNSSDYTAWFELLLDDAIKSRNMVAL